jgi:hypothetical protein
VRSATRESEMEERGERGEALKRFRKASERLGHVVRGWQKK